MASSPLDVIVRTSARLVAVGQVERLSVAGRAVEIVC